MMKLRQLIFEGPSVGAASLMFGEGLSILYGASNTGKSFVLKALDFMMGASRPLPDIQQRRPYNSVMLGLSLGKGRDVTLYRATTGGEFLRFDGLVDHHPVGLHGQPLAEKHSASDENNISQYLLGAIGFRNKQLVKNKEGEKRTLSFRDLARYVLIQEDEIISERSPVLSGQHIFNTVERNVFKLLLTGRDDEAVVAAKFKSSGKVARAAKAELVAELLAEVEADLGASVPLRTDVEEQIVRLQSSIERIQITLEERQRVIDELAAARRATADAISEVRARLTELYTTIGRFQTLDAIYASDIARLETIEEGGGILLTRLLRHCPVCGASPEHQRHTHSTDEIRAAHKAADAELKKILLERRDLGSTIGSLEAEALGLDKRLAELREEFSKIESDIDLLRPLEAQSRTEYQELSSQRDVSRRVLDLMQRREDLLSRRVELELPVVRRSKVEPTLERGVDGAAAEAFAKTVERVLEVWHFPGSPRITFDLELQDIRIGGKERAANGKGVRALLHAAFKVGLLMHCRERDLPHPGFVVLDTPLLTYREPLESKHGELSPDEMYVKESPLNEYFYEHLSRLGEVGQVIVIENGDPPTSVLTSAAVTVFTADPDHGRYGLFG